MSPALEKICQELFADLAQARRLAERGDVRARMACLELAEALDEKGFEDEGFEETKAWLSTLRG